jgi:hypothetical protein
LLFLVRFFLSNARHGKWKIYIEDTTGNNKKNFKKKQWKATKQNEEKREKPKPEKQEGMP